MTKRLGVLGGMGPQATQVFYQMVLDFTEAATDQEHLQTLIFSDTAVPDRTAAILSGHTDRVLNRLAEDGRLLEEAGCGCIAIPCNTSHYFWPELQKLVAVPILHMPRLTVHQCVVMGWKKVAVLGTVGTVRGGVYQKECDAAHLEWWAPPDDVQSLVTSIIYDEIKKGEKGSRSKFAAIDAACRAAGCDGAILACTELSVFRKHHDLPGYYLDAMEVLAKAAITACGGALRRV